MALRTKLFLSFLLVQALLMGLLLANSNRLLDRTLAEQTSGRLSELGPLLNAALTAPLLQRDYATLGQIIDETRTQASLSYLVVFDAGGTAVASQGWPASRPLPPPDAGWSNALLEREDMNFHAATPIRVGDQNHGTVRYALDLSSVGRTRGEISRAAIRSAAVALLLAALAAAAVGHLLTRRLRELATSASRLSQGDYAARADASGDDEVARLGAGFNTLAAGLQARMAALDESERRQAGFLREATEERARLGSLLAAMKVAILFVDRDGCIVYHNPAFATLWRLERTVQAPGLPVAQLGKLSRSPLAARPDAVARLANPLAFELDPIEHALPDGRVIVQSAHAVVGNLGELDGCLWLFEDLTREREAERLIVLAESDPLTGSPNRYRFREDLDRMIAVASRQGGPLALFYIDLDGFKQANDRHGHDTGDRVLVEVAAAIRGQLRASDTMARIGGDEFAVLALGIGVDGAGPMGERLVTAIALTSTHFEDKQIRNGCSIGVAIWPDHAVQPDALVVCADAAMYRAKQSGKGRWVLHAASGQRAA